jgi:sugar/nucleoside kinase (ribokinase family)
MALVVTGTIGIDSVYTPHGQAERVLGGSATYFAAAAGHYTKTRLVAAVGGDFPTAFSQQIKKLRNVDTDGIEVRENSKTFAWGGKYRPDMNGRDTLFTELGVLLENPPAVPKQFADSKYIFLANSHPAVQLGFLQQFKKRVFAVADTMDLWINTARPELEKLMRTVDGLVLNYDEAELFTGKKNPITAAKQMLAEFGGKKKTGGLKFVIVKKGEHGSLIIHHKGIAALPAYPAETVLDPTGAGDSFAGGLMGYLASKKIKSIPSVDQLLAACSHGTVAASFTIEAFSLDRLAKMKSSELAKRHKAFAKMVRI